MAFCLLHVFGVAQTCPPNIDFESGNLDGWRCYTGNVSALGNVNTFNLIESGQVSGRHTIIPATGSLPDPYGGFSTASPNGSAYCVKLGNDMGGGEGEAISYEFTIPANRPTYSLLYYYAVVFQDPNHEIYQQPRMEIEITNLTDNKSIECASFAFIPFGSPLPGFFESNAQTGNAPVWCKDWTPVSINLDGNAGKAIRLTFRTGDCTFRRHFGYAYIDVDSDCSGELTGASYCPLDAEVTVSAPFGFQSYAWFNSNMTQRIGTGQMLTLRPPPPAGTSLNVQLTPYDGYGCPQTLAVKFNPTLNVKAEAGRDTLSCNLAPVRIGSPPRLGLEYSWAPDVGLSNSRSGNPIAIPLVTTDYVLTVKSPGGGCVSTDTVRVTASNLGSTMQVLGRPQYCLGSGDSAVLLVANAEKIEWYKNGQLLANEKSNRYRVTETGLYSAYLRDEYGCTATTPNQSINISSVPVASFTARDTALCFVNNVFVFTNGSTNAVGAMRYRWDFGSLGTSSQSNVNYSFPRSGHYMVKLVVSSNDVCADSTAVSVTIYPNPLPQFEATATCIGSPFVPANSTNENIGSPVRYTWKYGSETVSTNRSPAPKAFASPGSVNITLTVSSDQCPTPLQSLTKTLKVETPAPARRYTAAFAVKDVPLNLEARKIGVSAQWQPALQLSNPVVYNPVFRGGNEQNYTITLTTAGGCTTVDSLLVQIVQKADIQVPTAFTPNGDGLNDYLRPVPMGVAEIRYFRVFNRYGEVVYESRNGRPAWDGIHRGIPQTSQTLVWMVEGVGLDGSVITKRGTSVLIR
jgi:gliding motility-associated-like protein